MPFKSINKDTKHPLSSAKKQPTIFVGRYNEIQYFQENILSPNTPIHNIVSIYGSAGVGKSYLLKRYQDICNDSPYNDYILSAMIDESQLNSLGAMETVAHQFGKLGAHLDEFEKVLKQYKNAKERSRNEQELVLQNIVQGSGELAGILLKEMVPAGTLIGNATNNLTQIVGKEIQKRQAANDAKLLEDPIHDLTKSFLEALNRLTSEMVLVKNEEQKRNRRIILFFDTFEKLAEFIAPWLLDDILELA